MLCVERKTFCLQPSTQPGEGIRKTSPPLFFESGTQFHNNYLKIKCQEILKHSALKHQQNTKGVDC